MKKILIICLVFTIASCREKSELDGVYVNQRSDTLDMYHTNDQYFRVRLSTERDIFFVKKREDVMEQKTGGDSVLRTIRILPEKKLELSGDVYSKIEVKAND